jgi:hypothetical protein
MVMHIRAFITVKQSAFMNKGQLFVLATACGLFFRGLFQGVCYCQHNIQEVFLSIVA